MDNIETEQRRPGSFMVNEVGTISRQTVTVTGGHFVVGQVLGKIENSGCFTAFDPTASDGSEKACGILYAQVDASAADQTATAIVRLVEVAGSELTWPEGITDEAKNVAIATLADDHMIVVR